MDWIFQKVNALVSSIGGWVILLTGITAWIGTLITNRLNTKWKKDQDREIEELRSELSRSSSIVNTAVAMFSAGHQFSQERRLKAIEAMWSAMLGLRSYSSRAILPYVILVPSEYASALNNSTLSSGISDYNELELANKVDEVSKIVEPQRPFLGEQLWKMFYIYRAFLARLTWLVIKGREKGKLVPWQEDSGISELLSIVLSEEEIQTGKKQVGHGVLFLIDLLEAKILLEVGSLISGEKYGEVGLAQAKRFADAVYNAECDAQKLKYKA